PPGLFPERNDKSYVYQAFPWPAAGATSWFLITPYAGRKYASIEFVNNTAVAVTVTVSGLIYTYSGYAATSGAEEFVIHAATVVAAGGKYRKIVRASVDGVFDSLMFQFSRPGTPGGTTTPLRINCSDTEV